MGIRRRYAEREVARALLGAVEARRRGLARGLCAVGEMAVAQARTHGSYRDRTGNLRASVGYAVALDGRPVGPGDLGEGLPGAGNPGRAAALRAVRGYPRGASLVVAAGMRCSRARSCWRGHGRGRWWRGGWARWGRRVKGMVKNGKERRISYGAW